MENKVTEFQDGRVTENIWLCSDGVYRWSYEMDMLRNPTILITVWKVLGVSFGVVYLFMLILDLIQRVIGSWADLWRLTRFFLLLAAVFFVISILAYLIVTAVLGRKYQVMFEMDENHVTHIQMHRQVERAQVLGIIAAMVGALAKNPATVGSGLLAASKSTSTSEFKSVRVVKVRRKRDTIHVNQLLDKNQVYAEKTDFDFVEKFIKEHCVNAKIR